MKKLTKCFLFFVLSTVLSISSGTVWGQWNTNTSENLDISGLVTGDMVSVPTPDGKTWIAFYHENSGNYDMRAQLIDADGYKLLGPNGVLVSNQPSGSAIWVFNACVDLSGNFIIGCQDERSGTIEAVLYKISQDGNHLWNPNGVILGPGLAPYPAALPNGEVVVAWNEDASGTLNLQKVTTSGSLAWSSSIPVTVGSSTTTRGQIVANLNNKFTMVFQKSAGGVSTTLYAQMYNSSGTAIYSAVQIGNQTTAGYRYYSITGEADTTYFGYYSSTGFRFNSFVQRINPNGTIPWGMNGSAFNTHTSGSDNYQMETSIGLEPGSPYIWSVCSFCDPNQTNYGVYVQKFLKSTGARQFTDVGKQVYAISPNRDTKAGEIAIVDDNPMFASYNSSYKIFATRLDENGNFAWPGNRVEISSTTPASGKGRFGFTKINANRCAGIWTEDRGSGDHGYAQGISVGGLITIDVYTQGGVPASITIGGGTLQLLASIFPSTSNQSVDWSIIPVTGNASITTSGLVQALVDGTVWAKAVSQQDITMADSILITISGQIPIPPSVVTLPATAITLNTALLHGNVNANYYSSTVTFEWGLTNTYGLTLPSTPGQVNGNTSEAVQLSLSGLTPGTTYHFRCVANNTGGTTYGQDLTFTTQCLLAGTISAVSGPNSLCAGTSGNVYAVDPFPGATTYVWSLPPGAVITAGINSNVITVNYPPAAESGNISVYATDGTCISLPSSALAVTVTPLPATAGTILGVQELCEEEMGVSYSITPLVAVTGYVWTVPDDAVIVSGQNTPSIVVNFMPGASSGNITVYGTNSCGQGEVSSLPVHLNPLPGAVGVISGPEHICKEALSVSYSVAPVTDAFGYVWTLPAGAEIIAGENTNQISVHFTNDAVAGEISVYATNGNCLGDASPALSVTVDPIPATPSITLHGDTLVSSADNGNQWYLEGEIIPGATGKEHVAVIAGNYSVIVTLNECSSAPSASILVLPVSIDEFATKEMNVEVYPNPSNGSFNIQVESPLQQNYSMLLYNDLGVLLWQKEVTIKGYSNTTHLNLQNLNSGIYQLVVRNSMNSISRKVLITQ